MNTRKSLKQLVSMLLVCCMLATMIPAMALPALAAGQETGLQDVTLTETSTSSTNRAVSGTGNKTLSFTAAITDPDTTLKANIKMYRDPGEGEGTSKVEVLRFKLDRGKVKLSDLTKTGSSINYTNMASYADGQTYALKLVLIPAKGETPATVKLYQVEDQTESQLGSDLQMPEGVTLEELTRLSFAVDSNSSAGASVTFSDMVYATEVDLGGEESGESQSPDPTASPSAEPTETPTPMPTPTPTPTPPPSGGDLPEELAVSGASAKHEYPVSGTGNKVLAFTVTPGSEGTLKSGIKFYSKVDGATTEVLRFKLDSGKMTITDLRTEPENPSKVVYQKLSDYAVGTSYALKLVVIPATDQARLLAAQGDTSAARVRLLQVSGDSETQLGEDYVLTSGATLGEFTKLSFFTDSNNTGSLTYQDISYQTGVDLGGGEEPDTEAKTVFSEDFQGEPSYRDSANVAITTLAGGNKALEIQDTSNTASSKASFAFEPQSGEITISFKINMLVEENNIVYMRCGSHANTTTPTWATAADGTMVQLTFGDADATKAAQHRLRFKGGGESTNAGTTNDSYKIGDWTQVKLVLDTDQGTFQVFSDGTKLGEGDLSYPAEANTTNLTGIDNVAFTSNTTAYASAYIDDVTVTVKKAAGDDGPKPAATEYWKPAQADGEKLTLGEESVVATLPTSKITMAMGAGEYQVKAPTNGKPVTLDGVSYTKYLNALSGYSPKPEQKKGEYFKFVIPAEVSAGELKIAYRLNAGKVLRVLVDGESMEGFDRPEPPAVNTESVLKLSVEGGKTYLVYVESSMPYFYGFSFRPVDKEADMALFRSEIDALGFDWIKGENTSATAVDKDLALDTSYLSSFGMCDVTWTSSSVAVDGDGKVNRLAQDTQVTLTANISVQQISYLNLNKDFTVTVKALADDNEAVASAKEDLTLGSTTAVKKDLVLPGEGMHGTTVTWVSSDPAVVTVDAANGLGVIHPNDSNAQTVTLTATITRGGVTDTKEFEVTVAAAKILDVNSWAYATASGDAHFVPVDGGKLKSINVTNNNQHLDADDYKFKVEVLKADGTVKYTSAEYTASTFFTHGAGVSEHLELNTSMDATDTFRVTAYDANKTCVTVTHGAADNVVAPGAKLFVIGDSTAAVYADKKYPQKGWAQMLEPFFDGITVVDLALPGRSSLDFKTKPNFETLKNQIGPGDYLIIQFGHNDSHTADVSIYTDPALDRFSDGAEAPSYKKNMAEYVTLAWNAGAYPIIATSISRRKLDDSVGQLYGDAARALAEELSIPCVDVLNFSNGWINKVGLAESIDMFLTVKPQDSRFYNAPEYNEQSEFWAGNVSKPDDTHVNINGATLIAMFAADGIKELGIPLGTKRSAKVVSETLPHYADAISGPPASGETTPAQTGCIDFVGDGWKLQLPVEDPNKAGSVLEKSPAELAAGYYDEYFYADTDAAGTAAVVFHTPVEGFKTGNTSYTRSELREMLDPADKTVNWTWDGTHTLVTEQAVTHVPANGRTITSQIHGIEKNGDNANPLVKVRYAYDAAGSTGKVVVEIKKTTAPNADDFKYEFPNVALGQKYKTTIQVKDGVASVTISTVENGAERSQTFTKEFVAEDENWKNTLYYYKVGNYVQDNTDTSDGAYADVWVYAAAVTHLRSGEDQPLPELPESLTVTAGTDSVSNKYAVSGTGNKALTFTVTPSVTTTRLNGGFKFFVDGKAGREEVLRFKLDGGKFKIAEVVNGSASYTTLGSYEPENTYSLKLLLIPAQGTEKAKVKVYLVEPGKETQLGGDYTVNNASLTEITVLDIFADSAGDGTMTYTGMAFETGVELPGEGGDTPPVEGDIFKQDFEGEVTFAVSNHSGAEVATVDGNKVLAITDTDTDASSTAARAVFAFPAANGEVTISFKLKVLSDDSIVAFTAGSQANTGAYCNSSAGEFLRLKTMGVGNSKEENDRRFQYRGGTGTGVTSQAYRYTAGTWMDVKLVLDTGKGSFTAYVDGVELGSGKLSNSNGAVALTNIDNLAFLTEKATTAQVYVDDILVSVKASQGGEEPGPGPGPGPEDPDEPVEGLLKDPGAWTLSDSATISNGKLTITAGEASSSNRIDVSGQGIKTLAFHVAVDVDDLKSLKGGVNFRDGDGNTVLRFKLQSGRFRLSDLSVDAAGKTVYQSIGGSFAKKDEFDIRLELYPATAQKNAYVRVYKDGQSICDGYTLQGDNAATLENITRLYFFTDSNSAGTYTYRDIFYTTGEKAPVHTGSVDLLSGNWKLTLSVEDPDKPGSALEKDPAQLAGGYADEYFFAATDDNGDDAIVFRTPLQGSYVANTALEEVTAWAAEGTRTLTLEQTVTAVPADGEVVLATICGAARNGEALPDLAQIRYAYDHAKGTGRVIVALSKTTQADTDADIYELENVALGQRIEAVFQVKSQGLSLAVTTNGVTRNFNREFSGAGQRWATGLYTLRLGSGVLNSTDTGEDARAEVWLYRVATTYKPPYVPSGGGGNKTDFSDGGSVKEETLRDGTVAVTQTAANGDTIRTERRPDGTVEITVTAKNGNSRVNVDADGTTRGKVEVSDLAASKAQQKGEALTLPMPRLTPGKELESAPVVEIAKRAGSELLVKLPVNGATAGTVAVAVRPDGTREIIKMSVPTADGVLFKVDGDVTVRLVDNAKGFDDVGSGHWAAEAVDFASGRELLVGTAESLFSPDGTTTRAMVVTILARLDGVDTSGGESWYSKGTDWAVSKGVSDGTNPEALISREQFVTMLYRYGGQPAAAGNALGGFADSAAVSSWATGAMEWAVANGIMRGRSDGTLDPAGTTTRAEAATLLMRYCKWALGVSLEVSAPGAGAGETVAFENDFEAEKLGRSWSVGSKVVELDGKRVVEITDSDTAKSTALNYAFPAQSGKVTISFKAYMDPEVPASVLAMTAGDKRQTGKYSSNSNGEFLRVKTTGESGRFQFRGGDSTKTPSATAGSYTCGEWIDMKVVVDTDAQTFAVYANGELLGSNQPMSIKGGGRVQRIDNITFMTEKAGLAHAYVDDIKVTGKAREFSVWDESVDGCLAAVGATGATGTGLLDEPSRWQLKQGEIVAGALVVSTGEDAAANKVAVSGQGNKELTFTVEASNDTEAKGGVRLVSGGTEVARFKLDSGKLKFTDMRTDEAGKVSYVNLGAYSAGTAYDIRLLMMEATVKVYVDGKQAGGTYTLRDEAAAALKDLSQLNFFTDKGGKGTLTYSDITFRAGVEVSEEAPAPSVTPSGDTPAGTGCIDFLAQGWKIQLPVENPAKAGSVLEISPAELAAGYADEFFYADKDEDGTPAVVFHSPVKGFKTGNTSYARSELRELIDPSDSKVNWGWQGTHTLVTEERVTHVPASGQVITSQIHGIEKNGDNANPLVKVRYVYNQAKGTGAVRVELKNTTSPTSYDFKYDFPDVALGQKFKTEIQVFDGSACVTISTTDPNGTVRSETYRHDFVAADPYWKETLYYFKLGNYIQDNKDESDEAYADVWVYSSSITHTDTVDKVPVSSITMDQPQVSIRSGERTALSVSSAPIKAYDKSVTWAVTEGADVAVVDKNGYVTGIKEGTAVITATSVSNPAATASCAVSVKDVAVVEVKPICAMDFNGDSADPASYGGDGCVITSDAPQGTQVKVADGVVTLTDDSNAAPAKLSVVFTPQTDTTTISFRLRIDALGERKAGGADFGRLYAVAAGSDEWYTSETELFRIRNNAKGTLGSFSGLSYVLTDHYDEIATNADKVVGGYGDWVDVTYIVTPNNGTAKANTTDVYMNGYPVAMAVENRNGVDYVNRLDIQTGTDDKLTFSVDDVKVFTGIVLPENTELVKPTSVSLVWVPAVMAVMDSAQTAVEVAPERGYEKVSYRVVSGDAVTVSDDGYITAIRPGTAEVRAESVLDSSIFDQKTLRVQPSVVRPQSLSVPAAVHVEPGTSQQLQVFVLPADAEEQGLKYEVISGSEVAAVNSQGLVTGKNVGTATIRVTSLSDSAVSEMVPVSVTRTMTPGTVVFAEDFSSGELDGKQWGVSLAKDNTFADMAGGAMTLIDANPAANPKVTLDFTPVSGKVAIQFKIRVNGEVTIQGGTEKSTGYRNLRIAFGAGNIATTANESFCIRSNGTHFTYNTSGATYVAMPGDYDISQWNELTLVTTINVAGPDTTDVYVNGVKVLADAPNKVDYPAIDKLCFSADTANVASFTIDDLGIWAGDLGDKPADLAAGKFSDMPAGHWAAEAIAFASEKGLLTGTGSGAFSPNALTTRATVVTILARLDGVDTSGGESWYAKGTDWAVSKGISDGTDPNGAISREQFVTMLYRYAGQPESAGQALATFADGGAVSAWAAPAMEWAVANGLMKGRTDGTLDPSGTTTRAEAATLLARYCQSVR